jgi:predicted DNA-binding transcriptional regulator AlpA
MEPLLDMEATGKLLGLSKQQVYELCRARSRSRSPHPIPFLKVGKVLRFRASSLNEWIQKLEQKDTRRSHE